MTLITLILAAYLAIGWFSLLLWDKNKFFNVLVVGALLWFLFEYPTEWLDVDQELLFLFTVGIGSMAYLAKFGARHSVSLLLFFGVIGYHWYTVGFLSTLYLFLLASMGSVVVQLPLRTLPDRNEKITEETQILHAYIFSIIAFGNIIFFYFLYGI